MALQTYVLFDYIILSEYLSELELESKNIFFANHYDRYAVLFDQVETKSKTILQHGIVSKSFSPTHKLIHIDVLYTFNEVQTNIWESKILKKPVKSMILVDQLSLTKMNNEPERSILIVNQPDNFEYEKLLIMEIHEHFPGLHIFYKLHPTVNNKTIQISNCEIISSQIFPEVNLVIHKESTLAQEYFSLGIKVLSTEGQDETIQEIKDHFNLLINSSN